MKFTIIICLLAPLFAFSQKQTFNGKLTYQRDYVDKSHRVDTFHVNKTLLTFKWPAYTDYEIVVRGSELMEKSTNDDGILAMLLHQQGTSYYLLDLRDFKSKTTHSWIAQNYNDIQTRTKTKETKTIMGLTCRKYLYVIHGFTTTAWIPEKSPYTTQRDYGATFKNYFFPDGLAFEIERNHQGKLFSVTKLVKMEMFDTTSDNFSQLVEEARK